MSWKPWPELWRSQWVVRTIGNCFAVVSWQSWREKQRYHEILWTKCRQFWRHCLTFWHPWGEKWFLPRDTKFETASLLWRQLWHGVSTVTRHDVIFNKKQYRWNIVAADSIVWVFWQCQEAKGRGGVTALTSLPWHLNSCVLKRDAEHKTVRTRHCRYS